jgi:hypothetical protein
MRWLERLERHFNWLAFPGIYKYLAFLGIIVFASQWARPDIFALLDFNRAGISKGEVWRLFTFVPAAAGGFPFDALGTVMLFFATTIAIMISDSMDELWGSTRVTLYVLVSWAAVTAVQFVFGSGGFMAAGLIFSSMFFAFATFFPKVELMIAFIVPIQIRFLGWAAAVFLLIGVIKMPALLILVVPAMLPYAIWVLPEVIRGQASLAGAAVRREKFNRAQMPQSEAFHRCETCGRTENSDPNLRFFTTTDGKEYCADHLPEEYAAKR